MANLNDLNETLSFIVNNEKIEAMHMDLISKQWTFVIQDSFQILISKVKFKCLNKLLILNSYVV